MDVKNHPQTMNLVSRYHGVFLTAVACLILSTKVLAEPPSLVLRKKWKLVWHDEFDYTGLPNTRKWGYESGHVRNAEQQYYVENDTSACFVSDGMLKIKGLSRTVPNAKYVAGSDDWRKKDSLASYTSASINTFGKASWKYGKVEIRAKLPCGRGIWPAFWMMGANRGQVKWPECGEIDIMEYIGAKDSTTIYGTIHRDSEKDDPPYYSTGKTIKCQTIHTDFHTYSMEWNKKYIDILFDGKRYFRYKIAHATRKNGDNPFRKPFYLLINLALGSGWPGPIDPTDLPAELIVDYVRVYQKQ
jgi:beta-glucanase (GH16 family)